MLNSISVKHTSIQSNSSFLENFTCDIHRRMNEHQITCINFLADVSNWDTKQLSNSEKISNFTSIQAKWDFIHSFFEKSIVKSLYQTGEKSY